MDRQQYLSSENLDDDINIQAVQMPAPDAVQFYLVEEYQSLEYIEQQVAEWKPLTANEDVRCESAAKDGGKMFTDERQMKCMRSVGKYVISQIGRKILSGDMNLTKISFPIKAMIAKSALEKNLMSSIYFPLYINRACNTNDHLEQLKLVISATIATFHNNLSFHKPLNPILGETVSASLNDGTQLYAEQISHHPPISQFYAIGPQSKYLYHGYAYLLCSNYLYEASAGLNSIKLQNKGKRTIQFRDGQKIDYNFAYEQYSGTIIGKMKVETLGTSTYCTSTGLQAQIRFGKIKRKPTDYFEGSISANGQDICKIHGTYMGYLEFDGVRYWDYRHIEPYKLTILAANLESDAQLRGDYSNLFKLDIDKAQVEKERLENLQRHDAKLRTKFKEYRRKKEKKKEQQEQQEQQ